MPDLSTTYLGLKIANPFIVSSSGFTRNVEGILKCEDAGASAVVMKSLFEEEMRAAGKDVAQAEYYHPEVMEYLRSEVELEYHAEKYFETIRTVKEKSSFPIIASLNAGTGKWWVQYAKSVESAGADALELNLYFNNIDEEMRSNELEALYIATVREVREAVSIPLAVKLSRYFTAIPGLVLELEKAGMNSVVLFNRFLQPDIDLDNFKIKSATFLDDPVGMHYAIRWISYLKDKTEIDIIGSGGVKNHEDLIKYLLAGASAVESCSVLYDKGLSVIPEIIKGLRSWMTEKGFETLKEVVGKASLEKSMQTEDYLRAQFVKTVLEAEGI